MPEVFHDHQIEPATLQAAITSGSAALIRCRSRGWPRLRMKMRLPFCQGRWRSCGCGRPAGHRRLAAAGIDADDGHAQLVVLVQAQAADQLVGQADLPAPPVPVMPSTGTFW